MIQVDADTWKTVTQKLRRIAGLAETLWSASYDGRDLPSEAVKGVAGVIEELAKKALEPMEALEEDMNLKAMERDQSKEVASQDLQL